MNEEKKRFKYENNLKYRERVNKKSDAGLISSTIRNLRNCNLKRKACPKQDLKSLRRFRKPDGNRSIRKILL